jgi:hypothetical protein
MQKLLYLQRFFKHVNPQIQEDFNVDFESRNVAEYLKSLILRSVSCKKSALTDMLAQVAKEHQVFAQFMQQYKQQMVVVPKKRKKAAVEEESKSKKTKAVTTQPLQPQPQAPPPITYVGLFEFMQKRETQLEQNIHILNVALAYAKLRASRPSENVLKKFLTSNKYDY